MKHLFGGLIMFAVSVPVAAEESPLFGAHIHYSDNAWLLLSPPQAIARLRQAGIVRTLVSSISDDGTRCCSGAPDLVVPSLRSYGRFVYTHSDADAVRRIFRHDGSVRILWAHARFEEPDVVNRMLKRYPNLWCELSMRNDVANDAFVAPAWRNLFAAFPERFLIGSDTYVPEQWGAVRSNARRTRQWLLDLPPAVRERIACKNGEELFTSSFCALPGR